MKESDDMAELKFDITEKRVQAKVDKAWKEYRDDAIAVAAAKLEAVKAVD